MKLLTQQYLLGEKKQKTKKRFDELLHSVRDFTH